MSKPVFLTRPSQAEVHGLRCNVLVPNRNCWRSLECTYIGRVVKRNRQNFCSTVSFLYQTHFNPDLESSDFFPLMSRCSTRYHVSVERQYSPCGPVLQG